MRRRLEQLATGEWAVLTLVAEGETHGFAVARALAPGGDVGRVWAMRRPLVYRTLDVLARPRAGPRRRHRAERERPAAHAAGDHRPRAPSGSQEWLDAPVEHVRDARSELMLKLLFLDRAGRDPGTRCSTPRRERFAAQAAASCEARLDEAEGFDRTLALWRLENTRAAIRFVEAIGTASH